MELKEIVGYLPYGLSVKHDNGWIEEIVAIGYDRTSDGYIETENFSRPLEEFKPILHPLSDLTKPITVGGYNDGKEFIPSEEIWRYGEYCIKSEDIKNIMAYPLNVELWQAQLLYQWHFDIHGLIERGEAIDINTLEKP